MRFGFALSLLLAALALASCSSDQVSTQPSPQPSQDAAADEQDVAAQVESGPLPDVETVSRCRLDSGADPVALCVQKFVLLAQHAQAFSPATGVADSWDSISAGPHEPDGSIATTPEDNVGYGASIARYLSSARVYGDTEANDALGSDLKALAPIVRSQLATLSDQYGGELYLRLRTLANGLRLLNATEEADKLDTIADAYGRGIYDKHYGAISTTLADGGSEGGASTDGRPPEDSGDSSVQAHALIGQLRADGTIGYEPALVSSGAVALLDLAQRHRGTEAANAARWQGAAEDALGYIWRRGRDPSTGMFYRSLVTSADSEHDALSGEAPQDELSSDVQATVAFSLLQATDYLADSDSGIGLQSAYPFLDRASELVESMNGVHSLWDSKRNGYYQGWALALGQMSTDKPTRANALMLAVLHRLFVLTSVPQFDQIKPLRAIVSSQLPLYSSLLSATQDQMSYFQAVPADFDLDGDDAASLQGGRKSYFSAANAVAFEGLDDQWYGWNR